MSKHPTLSSYHDVTPSSLLTCCREDAPPSSFDSYSSHFPSSIPVNSSVSSHHPSSRTTDLSPDKENSFRLSLTSSVNDDTKSSLPSTAFPSAMDVAPNHYIIQESSISSACEDVSADPNPDRSDRMVGIKSISVGGCHTLLLTYSGEVFGLGSNDYGQVLYDGPESIKSPIKLPLNDIQVISASINHSLSLSFDGKLYGWGRNRLNQINRSSKDKLPITKINIPCKIKEVYCGVFCSFALTHEGQVVKWGNSGSFELIKGLNNIVSMSVYGFFLVAVDLNGDFFHFIARYRKPNELLQIEVTKQISPKEPSQGSFLFVCIHLFVIDVNGDVWRFSKLYNDGTFNNKPTKVPGLSNIVFINGCNGIYAAINNSGKVFVWGQLSRISEFYEDSDEPRCIEAFTNVEGISIGETFLFAYNKNTVWAWGRNDKGQLGTCDLIDRPQPVKVFGSEILGSFRHPKRPLNSMFSGLVKLIYFEYLKQLKNLFGNCRYPKARFYTKFGISKKVAKIAMEVICGFEFLKDPQNLDLNENICELQLQLSTDYNGPKVINTRIKKLEVHFYEVDNDPELLSFFPNVEVIRLNGLLSNDRRFSLNFAHLSNLKYLELSYLFNVEQLPTSLVKLVFKHGNIRVTDLSYLTSLKELVVIYDVISQRILEGKIPLPQSIVRLESCCFGLFNTVNIKIQLPNLEELVIHDAVPANITEQNFLSLKFIQFIKSNEYSLPNSPLFPTTLINQGLIKSVKLIKNRYLVELSCFPWWIQYPAKRFLIDIFHDYLDETEEAYKKGIV
ncbi:hypothetical protein P9112_010059 [Eukaryota sp. TZLM1-RC]